MTADAKGLPWVGKTNRRAQGLFAQFVAAAAEHDAERATRAWTEHLATAAVWFEESGVGKQLMLEVMD